MNLAGKQRGLGNDAEPRETVLDHDAVSDDETPRTLGDVTPAGNLRQLKRQSTVLQNPRGNLHTLPTDDVRFIDQSTRLPAGNRMVCRSVVVAEDETPVVLPRGRRIFRHQTKNRGFIALFDRYTQ